MKYNELKLSSSKKSRRVGRGISAGQGKTAGKGTKGQNSRTGKTRRPGFEGGQNPLMQRVPKLAGFKSFRAPTEIIYTGQLSGLGPRIDNFVVHEAGLTSNPYTKVKVVQKGAIDKKVDVKLQKASQNAIAAIQKAGGSFSAVPQVKRQSKKKE